MAHDVSAELRGYHGRWTKGAALKRIAEAAKQETAGKAAAHDFKEGDRVKYKTGALGTIHHVDEKGVPHVVWDRGRGKPVRTPAHHLSRPEGSLPPRQPEAPAEKLPFIKVREKVLSMKEGDTELINGHKVTLLSNGQYEVDLNGKVSRYDYPHQAAGAVRAGFHTSDAKPPRDIKEMTLRETLGAPIPKVAHPAELVISPTTKKMYGEDKQKAMRKGIIDASTKQAEVTPHIVSITKVQVTPSPHGERGSSTLASHSGAPHTLHIKPEVLVGSNAESVRKANVGSWWTPTDDSHSLGMNVMTHEYGHGVHALAIQTGIFKTHKFNTTIDSPAEMAFWRGFANAAGARVPATATDSHGRKSMNVQHWLSQNKATLEKSVSKYGTTNVNELFAELWTEYRLSSNPRPAAKFFGDYLTKRLKGVQA